MYIGDLHIHSRYSRATSKDCVPEFLDLWARKKGIDILGTGDFTHPAWREELREKLEPAEDGLYVLKEECRIKDEGALDDRRPRFAVTGEISSIYKKHGRVRKVHSLILLPGLEEADRLARQLELIGNVHSDGRPILGLDCRDLLEIMLETCPEAVYVPAHIWTPHFSLFGAFSGFDRIEDCFEDLTSHIHALETGLSSDPPMNWRVSALDSYHLISNSDAHSPSKLGREANLFDISLSFPSLARAINLGEGLAGTLEFFPEEGKYHFDGHRKCGQCLSPQKAMEHGGICPVCGRKMTVGVLHRVEELADREEGYQKTSAPSFESLVPLPEVIAASIGGSASGKKVQGQYEGMLHSLGTEFSILREVPVEDIRRAAGPLVAEGILRLREGMVERVPGFDGEYGTIRLLDGSDISRLEGQLCLFTREELKEQADAPDDGGGGPLPIGQAALWEAAATLQGPGSVGQGSPQPAVRLNGRQQEAVCATERAVAVIAGPGSGKTKTLIARLLYLLEERKVKPSEITAVTFTNQAANEMRDRLTQMPGGRRMVKQVHIGTFHSICGQLLLEAGISYLIADEGLKMELAEETRKRFSLKVTAGRFLRELSFLKSGLGRSQEGAGDAMIPEEAFACYQELLRAHQAFDYDDLLLEALNLVTGDGAGESRKGFTYLLVDEFQDINPIQYRLVQAWNRTGKGLFAIGDPDQSIYGFRGSDARCFDRLKEDWPGLRVVGLDENYRSTPEILSGALSVISKNKGGERLMTAVREGGRPIRAVSAADERHEAIFVAKEINRLIGGIDMLDVEGDGGRRERQVRSFSDIAVVYRTHRQARFLEYCLRQEGIPYVVAGREDFLLDVKVRGSLYFFQSVLHPEDGPAKAQVGRLLLQSLGEQAERALHKLREKYQKTVRKAKPVKLMEEWAEDTGMSEDEAVKKLVDMSVLYQTMEGFLQTLSFGEDGDIKRCGGRKFVSDAVTLMTFHGSKGLEYPVVLLYGIRKGMVPLELSGVDCDWQEERRLFYVGMTRAREELIITASGEESPFIKEIEEKVLQREPAGREKPEREARQMSLFDFMG